MIWWLLGAFALGACFALGVVLTVAVIRKFRIRHNTKILVADMEKIISNMPEKEKHTISFDDLENCKDKQFITEFDPVTNEIIQTKMCDKGMDSQIQNAVNYHDGYIIIGD